MFDTPPWAEIVASVFTTGAVLVWSLLDRREDRDLLAVWVGATAFTLVALNAAPMGIVFSGGLALASSIISHRVARHLVFVGAIAATVVIMTQDIDGQLVAAALSTSVIVSLALWYIDRAYGHVVTLILLGGTATGIYVNVPDTEQIVVLAAALPMLAAAMMLFASLRRAPVSLEALALISALVMAAGAVGARGRVDSFIGVIGAIGVLLAEPVAQTVRRRTRAYAPVLIGVHAGVVIIASRVAGVYGSWSAEAAVAATLGAAVVLLIVLPRRTLPLGDLEPLSPTNSL